MPNSTSYTNLIIVSERIIDLTNLVFFREIISNALMKFARIGRVIEQNSIGFLAISPRTTCLLEISFERIWAIHVDNHPHIGLINAHTEGIGSYHYASVITLPVLLSDVFREMF